MSATEDFDGARMFARIAHELAEQPGLGSTGERVVTLAKTLTGCDTAAKWALGPRGGVMLRAATDPVIAEHFATVINEIREGVAWECLNHRTTVLMRDVRTDERWPAYRQAMLRSAEPYLSAVGYSLDVRGRSVGALILASRQPDYFTPEIIELGAIFAEYAAVSLDAAAAEDRADNLEQALSTNRRIGMAIGVLMAAHRCTENHAFDMLRVASQHSHNKLRDVAEHVVLTGALPELPARTLQAG